MDSMDLEREKGITILAKNTAVRYDGVKINIVDTPGHADFGGEVERGLTMVDGVLLLVDASEGPLPQTRFVLRKALEARLPVILVVNKVDRPDARIGEVVDEVYELFLDLDADEEQIEFPIVYTNAKAGMGGARARPGAPTPTEGRSRRCSTCSLERIPAPMYDPEHPLQALVTNLDASPYVGRLAICRVRHGHDPRGQQVAWCRADGSIERAQVAELYVTEALERVEAPEAGPGEIIAVAGIAEITIGETLADPDDPRPLPVITVDEPSLSVTIGINTSPLAGRERRQADRAPGQGPPRPRAGRQRVAARAARPSRPDTWEVQGRGELQLAVLVEMMRREGFELTVGQPQVLDARDRRPAQRAGRAGRRSTCPRTTSASSRSCSRCARGAWSRWSTTAPAGCGWSTSCPARGLIGFRTEFLTETRGTGCCTTSSTAGSRGRASCARARPARSSPTARGTTAQFALMNLQERGTLFVGPGEEVYEGMIVGENARAEDLDVNASRRSTSRTCAPRPPTCWCACVPHRELSLDQALELCARTSASRSRPRRCACARSCSARPSG